MDQLKAVELRTKAAGCIFANISNKVSTDIFILPLAAVTFVMTTQALAGRGDRILMMRPCYFNHEQRTHAGIELIMLIVMLKTGSSN